MTAKVKVSGYSLSALGIYEAIIKDVFSAMDPFSIENNMKRFGGKTKFYFIHDGRDHISCLFLNPVKIGEVEFGGIGGVATKKDFRGRGHATTLIERVKNDIAGKKEMLLLWTRVPGFFMRLGFRDASGYFEDDAGGSVPMIYSEGYRGGPISKLSGKLPRTYF